jgi:hypothetical protein
MSANTPLLTDSSRLASQQNVENYSTGVANHINGDFGQHVQLAIINKNWIDSAGSTIPNSKRLRILLTKPDGTDIAVVVPIVPFSPSSSGNGPQITQQPVSQSVVKGGTVTFIVQAIGDPALTYQWRHNKVVIPGAVAAQLVLTNVQQISAGTYDCVINNPFGIVVSTEVNLSVTLK